MSLRLAMNKAGMVKDGVDWELYDAYAVKSGYLSEQSLPPIYGRLWINFFEKNYN